LTPTTKKSFLSGKVLDLNPAEEAANGDEISFADDSLAGSPSLF